MKKYFCDVCGVEITGQPEWAPELGNKAVEVCGLEDCCPRCVKLSMKLDVPALVLAELRRLASAPPESDAAPPSSFAPVLTGRGAREKQAVLDAIQAYRREHGPGAISTLARLVKADESVIWDMIACHKVPLASWRVVCKALGVPECGEEG